MENVVFTQLSIPEFRRLIQQELEEFHKSSATQPETPATRKILSLSEFCEYAGLSRQTAYKLTSGQKVPHSKRGKRLYFDREKVDTWLLENQVATHSEIQEKANDYFSKKPVRRRA